MVNFEKNEFWKGFFLETAAREDVVRMSKLHYRSSGVFPYAAAWKLCHKTLLGDSFRTYPIGIITCGMPLLNCAARHQATGDFFRIPDKRLRLERLNRYVRRISRLIIDPRFRGLGLAAHLVRQTMPLLNVPMVEAISVLGAMGRFFERAQMRRFEVPPQPKAIALAETLLAAGIPEILWTDAVEVWTQFCQLPPSQRNPL